MNIVFLQPARQVRDLGVDLDRLRGFVRFGVMRPAALARRFGEVGAVVNCIDTSVPARKVLELAASRGVPRVYLSDGIYDVANAYRHPAHRSMGQMDPLLYTHIACTDRWSLETFAALGARTHAWLPTRATPASGRDEKQTRPKTATFLIATARSPVFDPGERKRLGKLLEVTIASLKRIGADFRFRTGDRHLLASLGIPASENDTEESFAKCVRRYRCLITTPSTIATTAMLARIPTATLDYRDTPLTQQTGWRIHGSVDIDSVLASMLEPSADRMTFQAREVAHLTERTPVEDFILEAAGIGPRPDTTAAGGTRHLSFDYPLRWVWVNWLKRFRRGL